MVSGCPQMDGPTGPSPRRLPGVIDQPAPPRRILNYSGRKQIRWGRGAPAGAEVRTGPGPLGGPHQRASEAAGDAGKRKKGTRRYDVSEVISPSIFINGGQRRVELFFNGG